MPHRPTQLDLKGKTIIPSEVRDPSLVQIQERRDSSAPSVPRNDGELRFSGNCKAATYKDDL
jgi:hypothetical protein